MRPAPDLLQGFELVLYIKKANAPFDVAFEPEHAVALRDLSADPTQRSQQLALFRGERTLVVGRLVRGNLTYANMRVGLAVLRSADFDSEADMAVVQHCLDALLPLEADWRVSFRAHTRFGTERFVSGVAWHEHPRLDRLQEALVELKRLSRDRRPGYLARTFDDVHATTEEHVRKRELCRAMARDLDYVPPRLVGSLSPFDAPPDALPRGRDTRPRRDPLAQ